MPRKPRVDEAGFHFVINRGVAGRKIYYDESDYAKFLDIVCASAKLYNFTLHSYSLLDESYYLLVETHDKNISLALRYINSNYAVFFNKKYNRSGHLWQGRYQSWFILNKSYLDKLVLFIEKSPLRCHLCERLEDFRHSGFRAFISLELPIECLKHSFVFKKYEDIKSVKKFFSTPLKDISLKEVVDELQKVVKYEKNRNRQRRAKTLNKHFESALGKKERNRKIYEAYLDGYTQTEIASFLNISQATVSNVIKRFLKEKNESIICI